jgi:hypothetical protein
MSIQELLRKGKEIWGEEKLPLSQIIVRMGKVFGDICRWERNSPKDKDIHNDKELKKELGNIIFSTIKFCDELGYNPEECIDLAVEAQEKYIKK